MIRKSVKLILNYTYRPLLVLYLKWERKYYNDGIRLVVLPGVFHPGLFHSTTFMLEILKTRTLKDKNILELGAGTGMLSVYCVKKGANVTASDISWKAIVNLDRARTGLVLRKKHGIFFATVQTVTPLYG
ncbi:MAG: methyltransferase [Bacteroidetes bacterium]|nr:methyltransferase [Bacteroidota bacterium]